MALSRFQGSVAMFIRTDPLLLIPVNQLRGIVSIKYTPPAGLYLISDRAPLAFYRFVNVVLQFMTGLLAETDVGIKMLCLQWTA